MRRHCIYCHRDGEWGVDLREMAEDALVCKDEKACRERSVAKLLQRRTYVTTAKAPREHALAALRDRGPRTVQDVATEVGSDNDAEVEAVLEQLAREGVVQRDWQGTQRAYVLANYAGANEP